MNNNTKGILGLLAVAAGALGLYKYNKLSPEEKAALFSMRFCARSTISVGRFYAFFLSLSLCVCVFNALLAPLLPPPGVVSSEDEDGSSLSLSLSLFYVVTRMKKKKKKKNEKSKTLNKK